MSGRNANDESKPNQFRPTLTEQTGGATNSFFNGGGATTSFFNAGGATTSFFSGGGATTSFFSGGAQKAPHSFYDPNSKAQSKAEDPEDSIFEERPPPEVEVYQFKQTSSKSFDLSRAMQFRPNAQKAKEPEIDDELAKILSGQL